MSDVVDSCPAKGPGSGYVYVSSDSATEQAYNYYIDNDVNDDVDDDDDIPDMASAKTDQFQVDTDRRKRRRPYLVHYVDETSLLALSTQVTASYELSISVIEDAGEA